ncbi:MAG TPA: DUF1804 family protein [Spirochaetota bacterium]|nr:DUF1804 family protein [Spirochaetota bacterium]
MADIEKKAEAFKLYTEKNKTVIEIADILEVSDSTVYRWKREDLSLGKDWDELKRSANTGLSEVQRIYYELVKQKLLEIKDNPESFFDSKKSDALTKHISNLKKIFPKSLYINTIIDMIKETDLYLSKKNPQVRQIMAGYWDEIQTILLDKADIYD